MLVEYYDWSDCPFKINKGGKICDLDFAIDEETDDLCFYLRRDTKLKKDFVLNFPSSHLRELYGILKEKFEDC